ncbi:GNAT family N-acetyltransferase [Kutzneria kofuensis]|nr:GNAT family N-acetyltransferase [Kutzneria kofuensis]
MHGPCESSGKSAGVTADGVALVVADVPASGLFEARNGDGELVGYTSYRHNGSETFLVHTVTEPAWRGRGVATAMTVAALDLLRAAGRSVVPRCPFVQDFLARHDELWDLVSERHRHMIRAAPRPAQATVDWTKVLKDERVANDYHPGE